MITMNFSIEKGMLLSVFSERSSTLEEFFHALINLHEILHYLLGEGLTKVELVLNEYLNNIIEHGLQLKKDTVIAFQFEITDIIIMTFWDRGLDWEIPAKSEDDIATLDKFRGMGIQIIHSLITRITKNRFDEINETIIEFDPKKSKDKI